MPSRHGTKPAPTTPPPPQHGRRICVTCGAPDRRDQLGRCHWCKGGSWAVVGRSQGEHPGDIALGWVTG